MRKLLGHRGAKGEFPENTILAISKAISAGIKAIEIDVHLTNDNNLVVIHDDTVDRTTNVKGKITDFTFQEIRKLDAGDGEKIPTLQEVIDLLENKDVELFIEIKALGLEEQLIKVINSSKMKDNICVICFNHRTIKKIKEIDTTIKTTCLLYGLPINPVNIIKETMADGISLSTKLVDKRLVDECHKAGYKVTVWNANTFQEVLYFKNMGADYIGSDYPIKISKIL